MTTRKPLFAAVVVACLTVAVSGCATPASNTQTQTESPESALFALSLIGVRGWNVECALSRPDGDTVELDRTGGGGMRTDSLSLDDVASGQCAYVVEPDGKLTITFDHPDDVFVCPFDLMGGEICRGEFSAGAQGQFPVALFGA
ncbi:MAG: hypothetical protein ACFB2Z_15085 [Maricaulaceae bacterium]